MSKTVEFYFDFISPASYLAYHRLMQLAEQYGTNIEYRPMLLAGVFKATGNAPPLAVPAKGVYMASIDLPRFARRYKVAINFNQHFPFSSLRVMRGALAARRLECFDSYCRTVFNAIWVDGKNLGEHEEIRKCLAAANIDADKLLALTENVDLKTELIECTEEAVGRGVFGAPTLFIDGEMYFGQDRLDFVEEHLKGIEN